MNRYIKQINNYTKRISPQGVLWFVIFVFIFYFCFVSFARHDNFYSRRLDLGNMDQTVWNVFHGNGFTLTDPMGAAQVSRLAVHADFLMIILAPLYLLWSNPKMLVLVQTIVVCLGAFPVYWIARDRLKSKNISFLFSLGYLLYPPLERMMLHDFHAVALSTTFLLFAYWYMTKQRYGWFILFAILAGLGKEQIWLTVGLMGLYITTKNRRILLGLLIAGISFSIFYYLFWHAIPAVTSAKQHFALAYLSEFGGQQNIILKNILTKPWIVACTAFLPDRMFYYLQLLLPVAFLPIFAPWILIICAHSVLINILSNNGLFRQIDYQYTSDIIPFLFIAAIDGYRRIRSKYLPYIVGICMVVSTILWGELPLGLQSRLYYFTSVLPEKDVMKKVEASISSVYTVSVTNNIGSHFSQRERLYNFPINALLADYSIAMLGDQYAWPSGDAQKIAVDQLLASPDYELIVQQNNFYAFKRKKL